MFSEALETVIVKKDFRCVAARWIDSLDEKDQAMVEGAIQQYGMSVAFKACRNYGYKGSESAFYRHAKGDCPCSSMRSS